MSNYQRSKICGGWYFFTVVTWHRRPLFQNSTMVDLLREAFQTEMNKRPFIIDAAVIMPDHIHALWRLPPDDHDFSIRWRSIKSSFSRSVDAPKNSRGEKQLWQRRFWEYCIRDEEDWRSHMDYIHYNPVKHGMVKAPMEYKYSSLSKCIANGWYPEDWGNSVKLDILDLDIE